jgi:hypothetical protein
VGQALDYIGALYEHEARIRQQGLVDEAKLAYRAQHAMPHDEIVVLRKIKIGTHECPLVVSRFGFAETLPLKVQ